MTPYTIPIIMSFHYKDILAFAESLALHLAAITGSHYHFQLLWGLVVCLQLPLAPVTLVVGLPLNSCKGLGSSLECLCETRKSSGEPS